MGLLSKNYFTSGREHALWGADTASIAECKTPQTQSVWGRIRL